MPQSKYFQHCRPQLQQLAYRMLGSVADAEDVVQDAYLRWHKVDTQSVDNPQEFLTTIVSRLCLDRLGEARRKRETYIGPWLPEPVIDSPLSTEDSSIGLDVSFALMVALERLSPLERAAFILHDVFDLEFTEVAATLDRSESACRQLAKRARQHIQAKKPRFSVDRSQRETLSEAFFRAAQEGDLDTLQNLLAENAVLHSDGGGKRLAALRLIYGADKICRMFISLARKMANFQPYWSQQVCINGDPGLLSLEADGHLQASTLHVENGLITDIYIVRNPDKLAHLADLVPPTMRRHLKDPSSIDSSPTLQ